MSPSNYGYMFISSPVYMPTYNNIPVISLRSKVISACRVIYASVPVLCYFKMVLKANPQLNNAKCPQSGADSCVKYS